MFELVMIVVNVILLLSILLFIRNSIKNIYLLKIESNFNKLNEQINLMKREIGEELKNVANDKELKYDTYFQRDYYISMTDRIDGFEKKLLDRLLDINKKLEQINNDKSLYDIEKLKSEISKLENQNNQIIDSLLKNEYKITTMGNDNAIKEVDSADIVPDEQKSDEESKGEKEFYYIVNDIVNKINRDYQIKNSYLLKIESNFNKLNEQINLMKREIGEELKNVANDKELKYYTYFQRELNKIYDYYISMTDRIDGFEKKLLDRLLDINKKLEQINNDKSLYDIEKLKSEISKLENQNNQIIDSLLKNEYKITAMGNDNVIKEVDSADIVPDEQKSDEESKGEKEFYYIVNDIVNKINRDYQINDDYDDIIKRLKSLKSFILELIPENSDITVDISHLVLKANDFYIHKTDMRDDNIVYCKDCNTRLTESYIPQCFITVSYKNKGLVSVFIVLGMFRYSDYPTVYEKLIELSEWKSSRKIQHIIRPAILEKSEGQGYRLKMKMELEFE